MKFSALGKIYNASIIFMALAAAGLAVADLTRGLSPAWTVIDNCIYWLFFADYFVRFAASRCKKDFIKDNVPDLIAILPFHSAFKAFRSLRLLKISKLSKLTKFARVGSASARGLKRAKAFFNTNGFKYALFLTAAAVLAGAAGISITEGMSFSDAMWWSFVTATTVGYGDLSPSSNAGRLIAVLLMLTGIGLIGTLTSTITSYFLKEEKEGQMRTDKVEMVLTMYASLSQAEKEMFKEAIEP